MVNNFGASSDYSIEEPYDFSVYYILKNIPKKDSLLLADALLFSVYGWNPNRIKRMKLKSIKRYINFAKKRMTWGDAFKMNMLLEKKEKPLWKKILRIKG